MLPFIKLIIFFCVAALLSGCATADTKLGITTNEGPRIQETPTR